MSKSPKARLSLTALESREMPSVSSVSLSGGILTVRTDNASTSVDVRVDGGGVRVRNTVSGWQTSPYVGVNQVDFIGGSGNDRFVTHLTNTKVRAWGQGGNDYLEGYNNADQLMGGTGNDTLAGYGGNDMIWGEGGDDTLQGMDGSDQLMGGGDNDALYGGTGNDTLWGGAGSDYLRGDAGWDKFYTDTYDSMRQRTANNGLSLFEGPSMMDVAVSAVGSAIGAGWNAANQQTIDHGSSSTGNVGSAAQVGIIAITEHDPSLGPVDAVGANGLICFGIYNAVDVGTVDVIGAGQLAVYVDNG